MRDFRRYLKAILPRLILVALPLLVFLAVFRLLNLPMGGYVMALELVGFVTLLYVGVGYRIHKKRETLREERDRLQAEIEELRQERSRDRLALQEYFLTWLHQMKTPLTAANLITQRVDSQEMRDLRLELLAIENYTEMAMRYLKLMEISEDLDLSMVELDEVLRPLLRKYSILFIEQKNRLVYEAIHATVPSDAQWLSVLVEQFLSNALKYTEEGTIEIRYDEASRRLSIRDTGCGIPPEDLSRIFTRGYSGFNGRYNEKSSGLGLFLAQQIADRLSIRIEVESVPQEGSTFSLCFPSEVMAEV